MWDLNGDSYQRVPGVPLSLLFSYPPSGLMNGGGIGTEVPSRTRPLRVVMAFNSPLGLAMVLLGEDSQLRIRRSAITSAHSLKTRTTTQYCLVKTVMLNVPGSSLNYALSEAEELVSESELKALCPLLGGCSLVSSPPYTLL
ncbi:hypothetical protein Tco_0174428 [Tanacetum coccineum]